MRKYSEMSVKFQEEELETIINRLDEKSILNKEILEEIARELKNDGWELYQILAHLDVMDIEERT